MILFVKILISLAGLCAAIFYILIGLTNRSRSYVKTGAIICFVTAGIIVIISVIESYKKSGDEFTLEVAKADIQNKTNQFTQAHITRDTALLNNSFADNAKIFPPYAEIVTGRKAIAKLNSDWINYGIHEFKEESFSFYGNENYLIDEGTYYLRYGPEHTIDSGKYINIWTNVKGEWKIYSNIWNSDLPLY